MSRGAHRQRTNRVAMERRAAAAPKNVVKLLLNLCLIAAGAAPRGGTLTVDLEGEGDTLTMKVEAKGPNAACRTPRRVSCPAAGRTVDAHPIQPYYTTLLARECGMAIKVSTAPEVVTLTAAPASRFAALADARESSIGLPAQAESVGLANPAAL